MSAENKLVQYPETIESFEKEYERYKPKDTILFCSEYFNCLQKGIPFKYKDLSGLESFNLNPEDEEITRRLGITEEDLVRVQDRRKKVSHEEILNKIKDEINKYNAKVEASGELNEEDMHYYLKFKNNIYRDYEFIRIVKNLEIIDIEPNAKRVFFTKLYELTNEEKNIIFDLCSLDYKITHNLKIKAWKETLILLNDSNKHTYAPYDNITEKLNNIIKQFEEKGQKIMENEVVSIIGNQEYESKINEMKKMDENELYFYILDQYQFIRLTLYEILKIKILGNFPDKNEVEDLYLKYTKIYTNNFEYLTDLDYYDYVLACFIPLIKTSDKTSIEHREMESYLNHFILKIPYVNNINFEEEKNLYYDIECVKYFLSKKNRIRTDIFKNIFIDIIQLFAEKVNKLRKMFKLKTQNEIQKRFNERYELINLQLREFYPELVSFTEKMVNISIKYSLEKDRVVIQNSLETEFKAYNKIDQKLILSSMNMIEMFESDKLKQKGLHDTITVLKKAQSIYEMSEEIRNTYGKDNEIIPQKVLEFYKEAMNQSRYDFNQFKFLQFKPQAQIINLIIKNKENLRNTALEYQNKYITPFIPYNFMINEIFKFTMFYFKTCFDKTLKNQLDIDYQKIKKKFIEKFPKENKYVETLINDKTFDFLNEFNSLNNYEKKLILVYINFISSIELENKYREFVQILAPAYLSDSIKFLKEKFNGNKISKKHNNSLYIDNLLEEIKQTDFIIYVYLLYDRSDEIFVEFNKEEKQLLKDIVFILKAKLSSFDIETLSIKEMMETQDINKLKEDIAKNYKFHNKYINEYKENDINCLNDFKIFNKDERQVIIKILENDNKNIQNLKDYDKSTNDGFNIMLKHVFLFERDEKLDIMDNFDLKFFFRKKLLKCEKAMPSSLLECISLVTDYTFDPNNTYLKQNFLKFNLNEQMIILEDLLCRGKILNFYSLYFEQLAEPFIENYSKLYCDICKRHNNDELFKTRLENDFEYLLKFFDKKIKYFILNLIELDNQKLYEFLYKFSLCEKKSLLSLLRIYAALKNDEKYNNFIEQLKEYLEELNYKKRLEVINNHLDLFLTNQIPPSQFFFISQNIKETCYEISYIIESINEMPPNFGIDPFHITLFASLDNSLREILLKTLQCLRVIYDNNPMYKKYYEELNNIKDTPEKKNIFIVIKDSFGYIDRNYSSVDQEKYKPDFEKLLVTLDPICHDLFEFINQCKNYSINIRKIRAISKEKVELLKEILKCENLIFPNKKLKDAYQTLSLMKFND